MLQSITDRFKYGVGAIAVAFLGLALAWTGKGMGDRYNVDLGPEAAATVDGSQIEPTEARDAWRDLQLELERTGTTLGEQDVKRYQDELLERLVLTQLVADRARERGYRVDGARLQAEIRSEPAFQVDGAYNETLALSRLAQIGVTAEQFKRDTLERLKSRELQQSTAITEFVTPIEYGRRVALEDEQRRVAVLDYPRDKFRSWVDSSEPKLQAWYASNGQKFLSTESVSLQVVSASIENVLSSEAVSEDDLRAAYAKDVDRFQQPERRRVRHILVADEKAAASLLGRLRAGEDFAALAKASSTDAVSAAQGGDLGISERGAFVAAFADAAFTAKVGELRGPVKTEFGYHIIRVDSIEPSHSKSFDEVRGELEASLKNELAAQRLSDLEDQAQRLAKEPGADLEKVASSLGLKLTSVDTFLRGSGGGEFVNETALNEAVFSDEALIQRRVVGPVAIGSEGFAIARVIEHRKPRVPPLAEVRDRVLAAYVAEQADALALTQARTVAAKVASGEFRLPVSGRFVDRRDPSLSAAQRKAAFDLPRPATGQMVAAATQLESGGAAVVVVDQVRPVAGGADPALKALRLQSQQVATAQGVLGAYLNDLRSKAEVVKHPEVFAN
jgi:peptidyl-prolyl cis-trans isomerase D